MNSRGCCAAIFVLMVRGNPKKYLGFFSYETVYPRPASFFKARKGQTHTNMTTENAQDYVELSTLELPAFAQRLIQQLKSIGRARIYREYVDPTYGDRFGVLCTDGSVKHNLGSFGVLMQDMALEQFEEGHIDEELADYFFEAAITRAILYAKEGKEECFTIYDTFIRDFFPLLVREKPGYYRMLPMEFRSFIPLMALIIHDYRVN